MKHKLTMTRNRL